LTRPCDFEATDPFGAEVDENLDRGSGREMIAFVRIRVHVRLQGGQLS
jgi:hypothetical protein